MLLNLLQCHLERKLASSVRDARQLRDHQKLLSFKLQLKDINDSWKFRRRQEHISLNVIGDISLKSLIRLEKQENFTECLF